MLRIKVFPAIELNEANALEDLRGQPHSLISQLDALFPLVEHDSNKHDLERKTEDENTETHECGVPKL